MATSHTLPIGHKQPPNTRCISHRDSGTVSGGGQTSGTSGRYHGRLQSFHRFPCRLGSNLRRNLSQSPTRNRWPRSRISSVKPSLIDHIFLQRNSPFALMSVGGFMNPLFTLVSDHNLSWVGILWPETPPPLKLVTPSARITNASDLPEDVEVRDAFANTLDMRLMLIMAGSPPLDSLTPMEAGKLLGDIVQASVKLAHELSPPRPLCKTGKGSRFKDEYSPEFILLKAALYAYTDIGRLLWRHSHRAGRVQHHATPKHATTHIVTSFQPISHWPNTARISS